MIGQVLGGIYRLYDKVGAGGFATVYLGRNLRTNEIVAVKALKEEFAEDPGSVERFRREARLIHALNHRNIVRVRDYGTEAGRPYLVMDYVEGKTLTQVVRERGRLPLNEVLNYVMQACDALEHAHQAGVVHRDIKPANLMITPDGALKVMDFGVARLATLTTLTHTGQSMGTPLYMAPEVAKGEPADARSDVYSLGIVLYELLAGKVPFDGESPWSVLRQQIEEPPLPLREVRADLPPRLEMVVERALAKRPTDRYQRTGLLADDLRAIAGCETSEGLHIPVGRDREATQLLGRGTQAGPKRSARPGSRLWIWVGGAGVLLVMAVAMWALTRPLTRPSDGGLAYAIPSPSVTANARPVDNPATPLNTSTAIVNSTPESGVVGATPSPSGQPVVVPTAISPTVTASPRPTMTPVPTSAPTPVFMVARDANVRSGPGTNYPIVGHLATGQRFAISGKNSAGDWWQFAYDGQLGWVFGDLVQGEGDLPGVPIVPAPPTPVPPPTRLPVSEFFTVSLRNLANKSTTEGYVNPPLGVVELSGVRFDLERGESVTTQAGPLPDYPTRVSVPVSLSGVTVVYVLITGGDLYSRFDRQLIGSIRLVFASGRIHSVDLIAGYNIREWKQSEGVVKATTSSEIVKVWDGANRFDQSSAVIDMLTIAVPESLRSDRLTAIELLDRTVETTGDMDPAINLLGITLRGLG